MLTQYDVQAALQIAIAAVVFSDLLTKRGEIFGRYGTWLENFETRHPMLAKPLGYCAKCLGGQVALWSYLIYAHPRSVEGVIAWASFVMLTIFLCAAFSAALAKLIR